MSDDSSLNELPDLPVQRYLAKLELTFALVVAVGAMSVLVYAFAAFCLIANS